MMNLIDQGREFLKSKDWLEWREMQTDQNKGVPVPERQKPCPEVAALVDLVRAEDLSLGSLAVKDAVAGRKSHRKFTGGSLSLEEVSFLLWATQGVREVLESGVVRRTVPSGGNRHPFETYLVVNRVEGLEPGLYRYLPLNHKLCRLGRIDNAAARVGEGCNGQSFVGGGAVVFVWSVIPYRTEWRYSHLSSRAILMDVGHVCQNLYIACEALGLGTCAIAAFDQGLMDGLIGVDGKEEFTIYLAPVGALEPGTP
jgi:SagB-type dehydrogenase family enzyme